MNCSDFFIVMVEQAVQLMYSICLSLEWIDSIMS